MPREAVSGENLTDENMRQEKELFPDDSADKTEFEFSDGDDDVDIDVVDDTPEKDKDRPERTGPEINEEEVKDEAKEYSKRAQDRISQLVYERHEERRKKEAVEREAQAASEIIKRQNEKLQEAMRQLSSGENLLVQNAKSRVDAQISAAKEAYKQAVEAGDAEAMVAANAQIARASAESLGIEQYVPKYQKPEEQKGNDQPVPQQPQAPQPQEAKPDPKAVEWAKENTWYGQDRLMTGYAQALHEQLVLIDGVDPRTDEYWGKVNSGMEERFPEKFKSQKKDPEKDKVVAPASRTRSGKKRVTLTESELRVAKRLGISREDYAKQKAALEA